MSPDVTGRGRWKEELLALTFILVFLSSFVFVAYVHANWETTTTEQVWVSDGSAIIPHYATTHKDVGVDYIGNFTVSDRIHAGAGNYFLNDTTALYMGNDTWAASFTQANVGVVPTTWILMPYEILNSDDMLMNSVDYELFYGIGIIPDKVEIFLLAMELDGNIGTGGLIADNDQLAINLIDTFVPTDEWDNGTSSISLPIALDTYEKAQLDNTKIYLAIYTYHDSGWVLHDASWKAAINGTYQKGLSARSIITWGLGFSAFINILVAAFMTDQIDLTKVVKAVKRRS